MIAFHAAAAQQSQGSKAANSQPSPPASPEPLFAPDTPVITMHGLCEDQPPLVHLGVTSESIPDKGAPEKPTKDGADSADASESCNTVVTRSQFENLINAINPNARPEKRRRFAEDYSDTALYAQQARLIGLDKTPEFHELQRFRSLEALSQIYKHYMQEKAAEIPDADVEKFYKEHPERFEQFALKRVFVPKEKLHDDAHPATDPAAEAAAMKKVAEQIRQQLVAGANIDDMQDKAYKAAGDKDSVLETDLGDKWTRDNLPAGYLKVVSTLKPGQVADPVLFGDGWYIFKLISTRMIPLSEARPQMEALTINDLAKSLKKSIKPEVNRAYFQTGANNNADVPQGSQ
ncbi:MAG: peptidylprolyl isomerase [Terriglobales bacterium]